MLGLDQRGVAGLTVAVLAVMTVGASVGTPVAVDEIDVRPDSPLYRFERVGEMVKESTYAGGTAWELSRARERTSEFQSMGERGRAYEHIDLLDRAGYRLGRATESAGEGRDLQMVEDALDRHIEVLENVRERVPDVAKPAISLAISRSARSKAAVGGASLGGSPPEKMSKAEGPPGNAGPSENLPENTHEKPEPTGNVPESNGVSDSKDRRTGRYIVDVRSGASPIEVASDLGLAPVHVYEHVLNGFSVAGVNSEKLEGIKNDPRVDSVEKDKIFHSLGQTLPTGIDRVEVDQNSTADINDSDDRVDVDIAIVDTGIDKDHPDLNVYKGRNFSDGSSREWDDGNGHGTHVAGIAAAIDDNKGVVGMAPGAKLWAVKVLNDDGSGYLSDVIAGVDWVTRNADEIDVANMSLGGTGYSSDLREAIADSVNAGVVYSVAAGNDGDDVYGDDGTFKTDDDTVPAAYPKVATISAMADSDGESGGNGSDTSYGSDDSFATFSNFSQTVVSDNPVDSPGAAIDLLMPGVEIYSTYKDGGYATMSGTSMASPHGAGLAALYIAKNGRDADADDDLDGDDVYAIRQTLIDGGVDQDSSNGLATLDDPDSNWERIGWASSGTGNTPEVLWVNPKDGDTVSGSVTIQISASDVEDNGDNLTVEYRVDGGSWRTATYNPETEYYEDSWDSSSVTDGSHTLEARAIDSDKNTTSSSITVETENTDDAPSVSWVNPKGGDTVKDTVTIKIDADDDRDHGSDLKVEWRVDDGTWYTATYDSGSGHYIDNWDTTTVDDGDHNLDARATDTENNTSSEKRIAVTVNNKGGGMYVWDISWRETGPHLRATVTILVDSDEDGTAESSDDPVDDATVDFTLTNQDTGESKNYTGTTDSEGKIGFTWKFAPSGEYRGEVTDVTHHTYTYDPAMDEDNPDYYIFDTELPRGG